MGHRAHPGVSQSLRALQALQRQLTLIIGSIFPSCFIPERVSSLVFPLTHAGSSSSCARTSPASAVLQYHAPRPGAPWRSLGAHFLFANPAHVPSQALLHSLLRYSPLMSLPLFYGSKPLCECFASLGRSSRPQLGASAHANTQAHALSLCRRSLLHTATIKAMQRRGERWRDR